MPPRSIEHLRKILLVAEATFEPGCGERWLHERGHQIAMEFGDDDCFEAAYSISRGVDLFGSSADEEALLTEGIALFLECLRSALKGFEECEPRVAANAGLDSETCRKRVLQELYDVSPQKRSIGALESGLSLSFQQVIDALDDLGAENALDKYTSYIMGGLYSRNLTLNANGRRLARGHTTPPKQQKPASQQIVHQHNEFHNSQIGVAGIAHGSVAQKMTAHADVAEMVAALGALHKIAVAAKAESVVAASHEASAELQQHGWTSKATNFLIGLGMFVQTLGEAKPAYTLVQGIAGAHGIKLPDIP